MSQQPLWRMDCPYCQASKSCNVNQDRNGRFYSICVSCRSKAFADCGIVRYVQQNPHTVEVGAWDVSRIVEHIKKHPFALTVQREPEAS